MRACGRRRLRPPSPHPPHRPAADKAPEQLIGGTIDSRRADVFSLGLVLYELLSLRAVFDRQGLFGAQALRDMRAVDALVADVPKVRGCSPSSSPKPCLNRTAHRRVATAPASSP